MMGARVEVSVVNLRIPGPTPCRPEVMEAVASPMINYRGPEMAERLDQLVQLFQRYLAIEHSVLFLTTSGTGGLEAAVVNTISPGDPVIGVDAGAFGERFCSIAEAYGARVTRISLEWGRALEPEKLGEVLKQVKDCRAVLLTHNETSTGVTHPLAALCQRVRDSSDALILVDGVSSLGAIDLPMDDWGVDVVITGSQKAWGVPPGLAMVIVNQRGWAAHARSTAPRFFFDFDRYRRAAEVGSFPFTPALPILYGLERALNLMLEEGPANVFERHRRVGERARQAVSELGLQLFGDERFASNTVTAVSMPQGLNGNELAELLRTKYDTILGGGQAHLAGKVLRIGHLGWVQEPEIDQATQALEKALAEMMPHASR